jgi:hypothetical protein
MYRTGISHLELRVQLAYGILLATYLGVALTIPALASLITTSGK